VSPGAKPRVPRFGVTTKRIASVSGWKAFYVTKP